MIATINQSPIGSIELKEEIHIEDLFGSSSEKDLYRSLTSGVKSDTIYGQLYEASKNSQIAYPSNSIKIVKSIDDNMRDFRKVVNLYLNRAKENGSKVYVKFNYKTDSFEEVNGED